MTEKGKNKKSEKEENLNKNTSPKEPPKKPEKTKLAQIQEFINKSQKSIKNKKK